MFLEAVPILYSISLQTMFAVIVGNEEYTFPFNDSHRRWGNHKQRFKYINHNYNRRRIKKKKKKTTKYRRRREKEEMKRKEQE